MRVLSPPEIILLTVLSGASFFDPFYYLCFVFVFDIVLSVPCSLVITFWERVALFLMFSCVCHFPIWCPGAGVTVWYLIV